MREGQVSTFSGVAGRVFCGSFSFPTMLTTVIVCLTLVIEVALFAAMQLPAVAVLVALAIVSLVISRLALNAYHGEWKGSLLSLAGGEWKQAVAVTLRTCALGLLWMAPLLVGSVIYRASLSMSAAAINTMHMKVPQPPFLLLAYATTFFIAHPIFLICAVAAPDFASIFCRDHWSETFSGRWGEVFVLCGLCFGGPVVLIFLMSPLANAIAENGVQASITVGIFVGATLFGLWLNLFAKLCGAFAASTGEVLVAGVPLPGDEAPRVTMHGPGAAMATPAGPSALAPPLPGTVPAPAPAPRPASIPLSGSAPASIPVSGQAAPAGRLPSIPTAEPPLASIGTPSVTSHDSAAPPLLDAPARVAAARQRYESDPAGAVAELEALRGAHAPNPYLLHGLCMLKHAAGDEAAVLSLAGEGIRSCLVVGEVELAAEIFRLAMAQHAQMQLSQEEILTLAGAYKPMGDLRSAARVYALVIHAAPKETRAIKGLLQVAEMMQRETDELEAAAKIYRFLLDRCADSPLAIYMQEGYDKVQRLLSPA